MDFDTSYYGSRPAIEEQWRSDPIGSDAYGLRSVSREQPLSSRRMHSADGGGLPAVLGVSPVDQHVACIPERCAKVALGVLIHQTLMGAGRTNYQWPILQVNLIVNDAGWWSDPPSVSLAHGDMRRQVTEDRFVYSLARHASLALRANQSLFERGRVAGKAAQSRPDYPLGLAADGSQPVGSRDEALVEKSALRR